MEKWIFSPFTYIAGWKALYIGLLFIILTSFIGQYNRIHFDGPLNLHYGLNLPFYMFIIENTIAWLSTVLIFYMFGIILSKSSIRFIDVAGTIAFARVPVSLTSLGILPWFKLINTASIYYIPFNFLYILPTIWIVILYYNAYSISCNIKGIRLILSFIGAIFIAEIISKITVIQIYKLLL
jgi:hypothetical protein